jgi:hypothetical protein
MDTTKTAQASTTTPQSAPTATTPQSTAKQSTSTVPQRFAYLIDDTCIALDQISESLWVLKGYREGDVLTQALDTQRKRAARTGGLLLTAPDVLEAMQRTVMRDTLSLKMSALVDEIEDLRLRLFKAADEAGVGLSRRT